MGQKDPLIFRVQRSFWPWPWPFAECNSQKPNRLNPFNIKYQLPKWICMRVMAKNRFLVFKVIRQGHDLDLDNFSSVVFLFRRHTYTEKIKAVSLSVRQIFVGQTQKKTKKQTNKQTNKQKNIPDNRKVGLHQRWCPTKKKTIPDNHKVGLHQRWCPTKNPL